jgi:5-methylcytosine-specific restriction endonuclease McrA
MTQRNTTTRDRHRKVIARTKPPCGICGEPIDYTLIYPHPKSFVVDHIVPLVLGGPDELSNKQAACADCNWKKAGRPEQVEAPRTFITGRSW